MHATSAIRAYPQVFPLLTKYYLNAERGRAYGSVSAASNQQPVASSQLERMLGWPIARQGDYLV